MGTVVSIDGRVRRPGEAVISVFDHGFLFGDSVYEVVRTVSRRAFQAREHLDRLFLSARRIELDPRRDARAIREAIDHTLAAADHPGESYVRIIVTRGEGPLDIATDGTGPARLIIIVAPLKEHPRENYERGVSLRLVERMRNPAQSLDPAIKSGNYLNSVLALMEARKEGAYEALMRNERGELTECTTSNIFIVSGGRLRTPSLESGILSGITRNTILDMCRRASIPADETRLLPDDLARADEAFITSTTRGIMPVCTIDARPVGTGTPGPLTRRLMSLYNTRMTEIAAEEAAEAR